MAPNLTQLLSKLRAPIFNTMAVADNARTGTKYLRRRLRGPSILNYVLQPRMPSLRALNANVPHNQFYGWDGAARADGKASFHLPPSQVVAEGWEEVATLPKPGSQARPADDFKLSGWVEDGREFMRFEDVARKRKLGKGPPPKGEFRR
jgi:hypothetical protein